MLNFLISSITDAQNECRDKVKFLESLRRPIDQFYHETNPISCIATALPGLCTSMRAVESVSRYYARQGYLGLLFTKVSNQLVNVCTEYLFEMSETIENEQVFYTRIFKELDSIDFEAESEESHFVPVRTSAVKKLFICDFISKQKINPKNCVLDLGSECLRKIQTKF